MGTRSFRTRISLAVASLIATALAVTVTAAPARATPFDYVNISTGYHRTCAVTTEGTGLCWGWNYASSLGTSETASSVFVPSPVRLPAGESFATIEAGSYFMTCGLTTSGRVYCWGEGGGATRVQLPDSLVVSQLSVGASQGCVVSTDARLYCWGDWLSGELGVGDIEPTNLPVRVTLPDNATPARVSAGVGFTCATSASGSAYCWGVNGDGQLGNGSSTTSKVPVRVALPAGVAATSVSAGLERACALDSIGGGWCWGRNYNGAFGDDTYTNSRTPRPVALPVGISLTRLQTGWYHTCGISNLGDVLCWGENGSGALGWGGSFGGKTIRTAALPSGTIAATLSTGLAATCATTTDGHAWCWGGNLRGSAGTGNSTAVFSPTRILAVGTPDTDAPTVGSAGTHIASITGSFVAGGAPTSVSLVLADNPRFAGARSIAVPIARGSFATLSQLFSPIAYAATLNDLRPNITYFVKAVATNIFGATTSTTTSFDTLGGPPIVVSSNVHDITGDTASVDATINANLLETTANISIATDSAFTQDVRTIPLGRAGENGDTLLSASIDSLRPRTTYWARVEATNEVATTRGSLRTFTTGGNAPSIDSVIATGAKRSGTITVRLNSGDLHSQVTVTVRERGTRGPWLSQTATAVGQSMVDVSMTFTNLAPATPFDVQTRISNPLGAVEKLDATFTTFGGAPRVDEPTASDIGDTAVTLRDTIDPNDFATRVTLQIDTDESFGNYDEWFAGNVPSSGSTTLSLDVTELVDSTTYFARFVASNSKGTTISRSITFTTSTPVGKLLKRRVNPVDPEPIVVPTPEYLDLPLDQLAVRLAPAVTPTKPGNRVSVSSVKSPTTKANRSIRKGRQTPRPQRQQPRQR